MSFIKLRRIFAISCAAAAATLSAGSLDALSNQSASYFFSTAQTASTAGAGIIPYNPAGTALLEKGFYLDASSQTIFKFYTESENKLINKDYSQNEPSLCLPTLGLVYNFGEVGPGKLAVYANGGIPAGGGGLNWKEGTIGTNALVSSVAAALNAKAPTTAAAGSTTSLEASSIYYGLGAGVGYSFLDNLASASAGVRYVTAQRSGTVKGNLNLSTNLGTGAIPWTLGVDYDYTYTASGFTPIFGLDIRPVDKLTLGFRYEMETALEFDYDTKTATGTSSINEVHLNAMAQGVVSSLDQNGKKAKQNLPQIFSFAAEYKFTPKFALSAGTNVYFLGAAKLEDTNGNDLSKYFGTGYELNLAGQYQLMEKLLVGGTFMYSNQGVKDSYYKDDAVNLLASTANPPLDSCTFGTGAKYNLFKTFDLLLTGAYIHYLPVDITTNSGLEVTLKKDIVEVCLGASYKF